MLLAARCPICSRPGPAPCPHCLRRLGPAPPSSAVPAAFRYDDAGRAVLLGLKYRNARSAVPELARAMAALVEAERFDVVTWAPTSAARTRRRGFDQAELLARAVAADLRLPCRRLLRRQDSGPPQTGRNRADREVGPSFRARTGRWRSVLLIDDVVTTGATLRSAELALHRAGAGFVQALAAAAPP